MVINPGADINAPKPLPDLSHHLSLEARSRLANPMKAVCKVLAERPNMISLANGDPDPSVYPIRKIEFQIPSLADSENDPVPAWRQGAGASQALEVYQHHRDDPRAERGALSLSTAFRYSHGAGLPDTQAALTELAKLFHGPLPHHAVTLTVGNSDGVTKAFRLLGERGDTFMTEEFSFPSMTNAPRAYGVKWVGIKMDAGGLIPAEMEKVLSEWNETERGRRPHVLYIVPCGQNPTGSTLSLKRRREIYEIAHRWDVIIIEDDPYYFLQFDLPSLETAPDAVDGLSFSKRFAQNFPASFLSMDVDGRVMRIDSFSKVLFPGMRLGWVTSSTMFHEKLVSYTDSAVQHPHGFGQVFVVEMLGKHGWQLDGFARWMRSLCRDYQRRRDLLLAAFNREIAPSGLASANCPQAGMFVWIKIHLERHPRYFAAPVSTGPSAAAAQTNVSPLMEELFQVLLNADLLLIPGSYFAIKEDTYDPIVDRVNFFRATFAGSEGDIEQGIVRLCSALREFFKA